MDTQITDMLFPSLTQYVALKSKIQSAGYENLCELEKTLNRNYNYGWQIAIANSTWNTEDDPRYDAKMASQAEYMFRRWKHLRTPDLPEPKRHSDEEIAHVAACAKLIRLYLDHGERRRIAAKAGRPIPPPLPVIPTDHLTAAEIATQTAALADKIR